MYIPKPAMLFLTGLLLGPALTAQTPFPLQEYGQGGCGTGDFLPTFHTGGEFPLLGNSQFRVLSRNLPGGTAGIVWISAAKANLALPELTLWINPALGFGLGVVAKGQGMAVGTGEAKLDLPLPQMPPLCWSPLFLQGIYLESSTSFLWSQGLELNVQPSYAWQKKVLHDRLAYQQAVTSAALGQQVWQANAVAGFTYAKTEQFTCGGQKHWMVTAKDDKYGIEFMLIPGGSYQMGDINNQRADATPVHWVNVKPFLLARTEISQAQWMAVMGSNNKPWQGKSGGPSTACAANEMSWNAVNESSSSFCGKTGWRLPSEAEWEYACRGGTTTEFCFGTNSNDLINYAWFTDFPLSKIYFTPQPVGVKKPNSFGLCDMHGNVNEWCQDKLHGNYKKAPTEGSAWMTGPSTLHEFRGGDYKQGWSICRSARRNSLRVLPIQTLNLIGLRPAVSLR